MSKSYDQKGFDDAPYTGRIQGASEVILFLYTILFGMAAAVPWMDNSGMVWWVGLIWTSFLGLVWLWGSWDIFNAAWTGYFK